jgi:hypothetical protein
MKNSKFSRKERARAGGKTSNQEEKLMKFVRKEVKAIAKDVTGSKELSRVASKAVREVAVQGGMVARGKTDFLSQPPSKSDAITIEQSCTVDTILALAAGTWLPSTQLVTATNAALFPLVSKFAPYYEKFRVRRLKVIYEPSVNTMSAAGFIYIDMMTNPDENPYTTEQSMSDSGAKRNRPDKGISYDIPCDPKWLYCQNGFVNGNNDISSYAHCKLVWASYSTGLAAGTALGKIKISCAVDFCGVRLENSLPANVGILSGRWSGCQPNVGDIAGVPANVVGSPLGTLFANTVRLSASGLASGIAVTQNLVGRVYFVIPTTVMQFGDTVFITVKCASINGTYNSTGYVGDISGAATLGGPITLINTRGFYPGVFRSGSSSTANSAQYASPLHCGATTLTTCLTYDGTSRQPMTMNANLPYACAFVTGAVMDLYIDVSVMTYGGVLPPYEPY